VIDCAEDGEDCPATGETSARRNWVPSDLNQDPRWIRLQNGWCCSGCGVWHTGLFDLVADHPESWSGDGIRIPNSEMRVEPNILSDDFCIVDGDQFFIRCVLQLPIIGARNQRFGYGVWSSLSKTNFVSYVEAFNDAEDGPIGPWFGWFSNRLRGYPDTFLLKCKVHPRNGRQRPTLELEPSAHPLSVEHHEGIGFDRILELYDLNGHETRSLAN
jgi:hypothetical protein